MLWDNLWNHGLRKGLGLKMKTKIGCLCIISLFILPCHASSQSKHADVITVDGVINPVVAEFITKSINNLMRMAIEDNDYATQAFLQWYITEQVEEEANVQDILNPLRMVGSDKSGLMMIDQKLGGRPAPAAAPE